MSIEDKLQEFCKELDYVEDSELDAFISISEQASNRLAVSGKEIKKILAQDWAKGKKFIISKYS